MSRICCGTPWEIARRKTEKRGRFCGDAKTLVGLPPRFLYKEINMKMHSNLASKFLRLAKEMGFITSEREEMEALDRIDGLSTEQLEDKILHLQGGEFSFRGH